LFKPIEHLSEFCSVNRESENRYVTIQMDKRQYSAIIACNIFGDWMHLATLGGHRIYIPLELHSGVPTLRISGLYSGRPWPQGSGGGWAWGWRHWYPEEGSTEFVESLRLTRAVP